MHSFANLLAASQLCFLFIPYLLGPVMYAKHPVMHRKLFAIE